MLGCEEYTETPVKFAVVIPEPASAEVTSSSVLSTGALTTTVKTIWSGDRLALLEAVTVTLFESSCPNASDGDITNANNKKPLSMAEVYRFVEEGRPHAVPWNCRPSPGPLVTDEH